MKSNEFKQNGKYKVKTVNCDGKARGRLWELGVKEGTVFKVEKATSYFVLIDVYGTLIAISDEIISKIGVENA